MKKRTRNILIACCAIAIGIGAYYAVTITSYYQKVRNITFSGIDSSNLADGKYIGGYDVGLISAKVEVSIKDGRIDAIDLLEHKNGRGEPAESIIPFIIERQGTDVDAVSGATNSSKVIRKAVENALQQMD